MLKLTIMAGHFASEASGPQKLQKYILRDLYASSLGKKTFLKVSIPDLSLASVMVYVLTKVAVLKLSYLLKTSGFIV